MCIIDWIIVALFLGTLVTIGYLFSRKNKNIDDYFVAGRAMPGWLVALAATGTSISAGTCAARQRSLSESAYGSLVL